VSGAKNFGIVFNAYMKFEEQIVESALEEEEDSDDDEVEAKIDQLLEFTFRDIPEKKSELAVANVAKQKHLIVEVGEELKFFNLENLIERRPFLLSNVILRQNPNNVYEWLNRVKLCETLVMQQSNENGEIEEASGNPYLAIKTFTEAIAAVDPLKAVGKVSKLWIAFAQFYERHDEDLENANAIFWKASQLQYKTFDELAEVYCAWAEMHVRHRNYDSAIQVLEHACQGSRPGGGKKKTEETI
jgi:pre-mRNA-splicing factor SYF1